MTVETAIITGTPARLRDRALAHIITWWRENVTLARIPLPMLSLAASFGVFQFSLLFVPWWVALAEAFAFEATYIGLSTLRVEDDKQRSRARLISQGSVAVSVIYNSLAAFLHRNPLILDSLDPWSRIGAEVILAILHGAPLAIVAYFVADLLLHEGLKPRTAEVKPEVDWNAILNQMGDQLRQDLSAAMDTLRQEIEANASTLNGKVEMLGQNLADHIEGSTQRLETLGLTLTDFMEGSNQRLEGLGQGMTTLRTNQTTEADGVGQALEELREDIARHGQRVDQALTGIREEVAQKDKGLNQAFLTLKGNVGKEVEALRQDLTERLPTYNCRYCDKAFNDKSARGGHEPHCHENPAKRGRAQELPLLNGSGGNHG